MAPLSASVPEPPMVMPAVEVAGMTLLMVAAPVLPPVLAVMKMPSTAPKFGTAVEVLPVLPVSTNTNMPEPDGVRLFAPLIVRASPRMRMALAVTAPVERGVGGVDVVVRGGAAGREVGVGVGGEGGKAERGRRRWSSPG